MKSVLGVAVILVSAATAALAHSGVQNATVLARMDAMQSIGSATKTIGEMAKGATAFNPDRARTAAETIAAHAARTPALFEPRATDPTSEAQPAIWENFDDFTAKARDLEHLAAQLATGMETPDDLRAGLKRLGTTCRACHGEYRQ